MVELQITKSLEKYVRQATKWFYAPLPVVEYEGYLLMCPSPNSPFGPLREERCAE